MKKEIRKQRRKGQLASFFVILLSNMNAKMLHLKVGFSDFNSDLLHKNDATGGPEGSTVDVLMWGLGKQNFK